MSLNGLKNFLKSNISYMNKKTLFEKIIDREISSEIIYEDDLCIAIEDINPQAPTHILLIPKKPIEKFSDLNQEDKDLLAHLCLKVNEIALRAHKLLGCRGITRSDFKFYKNKFYLLELNTQPGMTNLSLVPEIAAHEGIDFKSLINWMIDDASTKR